MIDILINIYVNNHNFLFKKHVANKNDMFL